MKSLFFRLYLLLILAFIGLGWGIDKLFDSYTEQHQQTSDLDLHRGSLFLLNSELQRRPAAQRADWLAALAPSFGYPLQVLDQQPLAQLTTLTQQPISEQQQQYLQQGGVISLFNDFAGESWFVRQISGSQQLILLGPIYTGTPAQAEVFYLLLFMAGLAIIVLLWAMPLSKGLLRLKQAANRFGQGDFSVRAQTDVSAPLQSLVEGFNAMAARIQRLLKSHQELSHAISHELRTPIARLRFAMEMVRELRDPERVGKYLDTMDDNIEELDSLVDELLIYAKFDRDAPQLQRHKQSLTKLVEQVLARFRETDAHLDFIISQPLPLPDVSFDSDAMSRILDNLVRNAVRYAKHSIEISLHYTGQCIELCVNDDGPGVPEESRHNLFEPFVRLDKSRDRKSGGIGLGLAIVKRYIELHHGRVEIDQSNMGGACFRLYWPDASDAERE